MTTHKSLIQKDEIVSVGRNRFIQLGKIAAYSAYEMFSWYQYLVVGFFPPRFWEWESFSDCTFF